MRTKLPYILLVGAVVMICGSIMWRGPQMWRAVSSINFFRSTNTSTVAALLPPATFDEAIEMLKTGHTSEGCIQITRLYPDLNEQQKDIAHAIMALHMLSASEPTAHVLAACGRGVAGGVSSTYAGIYDGLLRYINQDYDAGIKIINNVVVASPTNTLANLVLAKAITVSQKRKITISYGDKILLSAYRQFFRFATPTYPGYIDATDALFDKRQWSTLVTVLNAATRTKDWNAGMPDLDTADIYFSLCYAQLQLGILNGAAQSCRLAIHFRPDSYAAYNNLALVYEDMGYYQKALDMINVAIEIEDDMKLGTKNEEIQINKRRIQNELRYGGYNFQSFY